MSQHHDERAARVNEHDSAPPAARSVGRSGLGRRAFLRSAGLITGGAAIGATTTAVVRDLRSAGHARTADPGAGTAASPSTVAFYGARQAGVVDRPPPQLRFTAYDLADPAIAGSALQGAFQRLSSAAAQLMAGRRIAEQGSVSTGSTPAGLQITIGVGERVIRAAGATLPGPMAPIPPFPGEDLDAAASGGDLAISVCGDDPLLTSSAARALGTLLAAWFRPRWTRSGFLPAATEPGSTPRNLMGQLDGTDNPAGARQDLAVWVAPGADVAWMADGTYLVCRRIRMKLAAWDGLTTAAKQRVIGRELVSGAPLSGGTEHSTPSFTALDAAGTPVIPADAHIRLSHPAHNAGATMMRRGYSYDDGYLPDGQPRAGLFFQAFQTDPRATFVPIQRRLASTDALSAFTVHETSALFAVLPGASQGGFVGETLFLG